MDDGYSWGEEECVNVPIEAAKDIAEKFCKDQVIIVCWDGEHSKSHVTTYGKSLLDCKRAAVGGNIMKEALGWPDKLCHDVPERVKKVGGNTEEASETLIKLQYINDNACIYNIHYCKVGVGFQFFEEKRITKGDRSDRTSEGWREGLINYRYYSTFTEAVGYEYARLQEVEYNELHKDKET